ncbi:integrase [Enterococcus sp. PF1-24]|uniref:site-specific integrase n=1 Tax=unclassified Enterococcus TaxID=2608891 RepID=UPI0024739A04|nr:MULTISPECIES: site-specific integrase [unclassified Enterococcus]MDH6363283.1 integrase [Enterococcus sp. PFB1-1]MDH6400416.1 integrase [Enterococcus sp. PF1-24]
MATFKQYEKKDGTKAWQFQAYLGIDPINGKPIKTTRRNFKTKKEAQLALSRLQVNFENGEYGKNKNYTFETVYQMWLEQHQNTVKPTTAENIEKRFKNQILPLLGDLKIEAINTYICQKAVNEWFKKVVAYQQIKSYASQVFNYAINNGIIKSNPMQRVIMPKKNGLQQKKVDFYSKEELQQFFDCIKKENNLKMLAFFRIAAFAGLRRGELSALTWSDIDFEKKRITVDKNLVLVRNEFTIQSPKTRSSNRTISLDETTLAILKKWRLKQRESLFYLGRKNSLNLIFTNSTGKTGVDFLYLTYGSNSLKYLSDKYGIRKIKLHDLRKTHASLLFEAGAEIKDVQERLGHSDIQTTYAVYIGVSKDREEKIANQFAKYVNF